MSERTRIGGEKWILTAAIMAVCGMGALVSVHALDTHRQAVTASETLTYLPKGEYLKIAALGYRQIVADLLWLKAVQGLAGREQTREGYLGAYHAVDVLTDLDPHFIHAYQYTGTVLGVLAGMPKESALLLAKGVQQNPTAWQLSFFLGYDYYYELRDPASAAVHFKTAAMQPGAPPWLAGLAARMDVEAKNPTAALEFLQRLYLQTDDESLREKLAQRIRETTAERDIAVLEASIATYRARVGKTPETLEDLVKSGILTAIPPEPFGGRYEFSVADGSVRSTGLQERLRVYTR